MQRANLFDSWYFCCHRIARSLIIGIVITILGACSGLHSHNDPNYARGPIAYPVAGKNTPPADGIVFKRKSIQTRFQFHDGTILSLGSDGHSIFSTVKAIDNPITTQFTIAMIFHWDNTTVALSNFGNGIIVQPHQRIHNFSLNMKALSDQTNFISGILLPDSRLALGSMQNSLIITAPIHYDSPAIIPIEQTIKLQNSPDSLVFSQAKDNVPYIYAINIKQATITEIDIHNNRPGIFQLAGNSIGDFTQNKNILVTTDPRKKAINIMTLDPLVTHIYAPVPEIPRNVCFINRDTIAVSFPAISKINLYTIDTGDLIYEKSYNSIDNIYLMTCSPQEIISDGEDRLGTPSSEIISLIAKPPVFPRKIPNKTSAVKK